MAVTTAEVLQALIALLPPGHPFSLEEGSNVRKLLEARAEGLARIFERAETLVQELDPATTYELLPVWERAVGLPDADMPELLSVADRRAAVIARLTAVGEQTPAYFIRLAESLGYLGATIDQYDVCHCESTCEDSLFEEDWRFVFTLHLPVEPEGLGATCEGSCEDYLGTPPNNRIERLINRYKPKHTRFLFAYGA